MWHEGYVGAWKPRVPGAGIGIGYVQELSSRD